MKGVYVCIQWRCTVLCPNNSSFSCCFASVPQRLIKYDVGTGRRT